MIVAIALVLILSVILAIVGKLLRKKAHCDRDLQSPFECGFPTLNESRISFSLHFFIVALVFAVWGDHCLQAEFRTETPFQPLSVMTCP